VAHRIIAVTPAGRRRYMACLARYVLADDSIDEWHLWDNCRKDSDRLYIRELAGRHQKIRLVTVDGADGETRNINRFYHYARDADAFYIKMDDDLVYLPPNLGRELYTRAMAERGRSAWWSPLVINNAICSWLLKYHSRLRIDAPLSASASCEIGWRNPEFAHSLHSKFLEAAAAGGLDAFRVGDFDVALSRFSINCIGYFGEDAAASGDAFCPLGVDDEEWISAVWPSRTGKPGRILGDILVSHFAFYTQDRELRRSDLIARYYRLAGLPSPEIPEARRAAEWSVKTLFGVRSTAPPSPVRLPERV
jgi:hypothetical protein